MLIISMAMITLTISLMLDIYDERIKHFFAYIYDFFGALYGRCRWVGQLAAFRDDIAGLCLYYGYAGDSRSIILSAD